MVVERDQKIIPGRRFPGQYVGNGRFTDKRFISEPVSFAHIRVRFGAQRNFGRGGEQHCVAFARRSYFRRISRSGGEFGLGSRQEWWRRATRQAGALKKLQQIARPELVDFAPELAGSV